MSSEPKKKFCEKARERIPNLLMIFDTYLWLMLASWRPLGVSSKREREGPVREWLVDRRHGLIGK